MSRWRGLFKKAAALTLAAVRAGTYTNVGALATFPAFAASQKKEVILAFEELPEEVSTQEISAGAKESKLVFPKELSVTLRNDPGEIFDATPANASKKKATSSNAYVYDEKEELPDGDIIDDVNTESEAVLESVSWKLDRKKSSADSFSSGTAGDRFVFRPVIPKGYQVAAGIELPEILAVIAGDGTAAVSPAFEAQETVDGITVTVTAEEGAFPEGAKLVVRKVPAEKEEEAEAAVAEKREEGRNVAVSYTFYIRVEDEAGNELQPAEEKQVKVSFAAVEAADRNLEADIYHITEKDPEAEENSLSAEKLEAETDEKAETVTAETDGFSLYTVEFTYQTLQYVMQGGTEIPLKNILTEVGLGGKVTAAEVSDSTLFAVLEEEGEWVVRSYRPFSTSEWMKVTINGIVYEITVTDAPAGDWAALQAAFTAGGSVELSGNVTASPSDNRLVVPNDGTVVLDLKGHKLNRNLNSKDVNGEVIIVAGKLTIMDSGNGGRITGGYTSLGGGIYVQSGGELVLEGGSISGNRADSSGGGVVVAYGGKFTMNGGTISDNEAANMGGGIFAQCEQLSLNGGSVSNNKAAVNGGGIWFYHDCNIQGNVSITGNKCGAADNNLYIAEKTVKVTAKLNSAASIGITTNTDPEVGSPFDFASAVNSSWLDAKVFKSDKEGYVVGRNGTDKLALFVPNSVTVSGITASDKAYDGTTGAALDFSNALISGKADGDELTITGTGTFENANAGTGKTVNITGLTLGGADAGKYVLADSGNQSTATASITPKEVGLTWGSTSFAYDGSSHVPSASVTSGLIGSDSCTVTVSGSQKNAGTYTAAASGLSNSNYKLPSARTTSFTIGKKKVTLSGIKVDHKIYDKSTVATVDLSTAVINGIVTGDDLSLAGATGTFDNYNAGSGHTVTVSGYVFGGADAGNYYAEGTTTVHGIIIERKAIGLSWGEADFTYNGLPQAPDVTATGLIGDDTCTVSKNIVGPGGDAGSYTAIASGVDNYNYRLPVTEFTKDYEIKKAPLTVVTQDGTKVYDGAPLTAAGSFSGLVGSETATLNVTGSRTEVGSSPNSYEIVWDGTAKEDNYQVAAETLGTLTITEYAGQIDVTTTGGTWTYDGLSHGATVDVSPLPAGYTLVSAASGATATDVTASEIPATADTLVIENASHTDVTGNLNIKKTDGTIAITPAALTVTTPDASKVYDGTPLAAVGSLSGLVGGETATLNAKGAQTEVGSSPNSYEIVWDGTAKEGNYQVGAETLGTLTVTEYTGQIDVTTTGGTFSYDGLPHGATVDVSTLPSGYTLVSAASGATATDVTVSDVPATADTLVIENASHTDVTWNLNIKKTDGSIAITPAALTVTTPDASKVYDGTPLTAEGTVTGLMNGETATLNTKGTQTDAGSSTNSYEILWDGTAKGSNYAFGSETLGTLTVEPREVIISGIKAVNKIYDGRAEVELNYDDVVINGLVAGDELTVSAFGACDDPKAAKGKNVTISGLALAGADAGNYRIAGSGNQTSATVDIKPAPSDDSDFSDSDNSTGTWHQNGMNWTYTLPGGRSASGWNYLYYKGRTDWYFFAENGIMQTGWLDWGGFRYYLNPVPDGWRGAIITGWRLVDGKWYYFEPVKGKNQGRMYLDEQTPDGFRVGPDGMWIQ